MYTINMILDVLVSAILVIESVLCLPFTTLAFHFDAKASVFESGDNMYTVIWSTSLPGTGYVTYNYDGVEYTVTDTENAAIRTTDTIHSVRIPKSHLDNNTNTVEINELRQAMSKIRSFLFDGPMSKIILIVAILVGLWILLALALFIYRIVKRFRKRKSVNKL